MQRNSYKFYIDKVIQPLRTKMQRITLFMSLSDEDLPVIPQRRQYLNQFVTQTRMYFNDNQLLIFKDPQTRQNYLTSQEFQTRLMQVLNKLIENKKTYDEINFVDVIEEWLTKDVLIQVWYKIYDDVVKSNVEEYLMNVGNEVAVGLAKQMNNNKKNNKNSKKNSNDIGKIMIINKHKSQQKMLPHKKDITKLAIHQQSTIQKKSPSNNILPFILSPNQQSSLTQQQSSQISPSQQPNDTYTYYLQKFYLHYAKKSPNTNQTQQFQQLQHFFTTINLNKFMLYCKEIGLLKIDKKITINYVKKLFVNNQDQRKVVQFQVFAKIINEMLLKVFKTEDEVKQQGYQIIGVKDRRNFVQTMAKIGVLIPLRKIVFSKVQNVKKEKKTIVDLEMLDKLKSQEKKSQQLGLKQNKNHNSLSKLQKSAILTSNGGYSQKLRPSPQREQQNINYFTINNNIRQLTKSSSSTSLSTLPTIYSHKQQKSHHKKQTKMLQQLLQLDVQNDDDPYLQRFKDQQLKFEKQQQKQRQKYLVKRRGQNIQQQQQQKKDKNNWGHHKGVIQRMDKRIDNMVRKVR